MQPTDSLPPDVQFFEPRRSIFPKAVDGTYRRLKWAVMAVALTVYYVTPWLRWDRGPFAPHQAVLVDLAHRRFYMFSIEIWPHEFYYVAGLLIMAGVGLFLVTSSVGRAWCGYACPQTVWTDLFLHVERAVDGDRNAQIKLRNAPWTVGKIARRALKHGIWLLIGLITGGAWVFYFTDAPTLARELATLQAPLAAFATIAVLTFTTYTLGGLMREQVCIYMCPWPRIQSAMLDEQSMTVTYKEWRGEPRSHGLKRGPIDLTGGQATLRAGDCIDCNACVAVCPTGIDIREGPQIGCITCGLCIDACDKVMKQVDRPPRLIGYTTLADAKMAKTGGVEHHPLRRLLRPRSVIYFGVWVAIGAAMLFTLGTRTRLDLSVGRDRNPVWVKLSDGAVRNSYTVNVRNMEDRPRQVEVAITDLPGAVLWTENGDRATASRSVRLSVDADQVTRSRMFVAAPADGEERTDLHFTVRALDPEGGSDVEASVFERPEDQP